MKNILILQIHAGFFCNVQDEVLFVVDLNLDRIENPKIYIYIFVLKSVQKLEKLGLLIQVDNVFGFEDVAFRTFFLSHTVTSKLLIIYML